MEGCRVGMMREDISEEDPETHFMHFLNLYHNSPGESYS